MASTFTPNKDLAEPALGDTGWDVPLNNNFTILDNVLGSTAGFSLSGSDVTLSTANIQSMRISLTGTLLTNVNVIFPAGVAGSWLVTNLAYNSASSFYVTLKTSAVGATIVLQNRLGNFQVFSDGTNMYIVDNATPPGAIQAFGWGNAPFGWIACDGASYATSTYPALFANIGYTWGQSGSLFKVPDLRGAFLRGSGAGLNPSTRTVGSYQADSFVAHNHGIPDPGHVHTQTGETRLASGGITPNTWTSGPFGVGTVNTQASFTGITATNSNSTPPGGTETAPKNFAVLWCIKT